MISEKSKPWQGVEKEIYRFSPIPLIDIGFLRCYNSV